MNLCVCVCVQENYTVVHVGDFLPPFLRGQYIVDDVVSECRRHHREGERNQTSENYHTRSSPHPVSCRRECFEVASYMVS